MKGIEFGEQIGRSWLTCQYGGRQVDFAFPPVQGTHVDAYTKINSDPEIAPAEGFDLALLANGAYSAKTKSWANVRDDAFVRNYVRVPIRVLWMPKKDSLGEENGLAGVIIERDLQGRGLSTKMNVPDVSGWKNENGIYVNADRSVIYVPQGQYRLGDHDTRSFEKDGFARAVLTDEGAEIYAKTAVDNRKIPRLWGINISEIQNPEQRVPLLGEYDDRLDLDGGSRGNDRGGCAFGVRRDAAPNAAQK